MEITVFIYYTGCNGNARKFAREMSDSGIVSEIRQQEGNLMYEYFFPMEQEETVLLIDRWKSREAIDVHHASPMMKRITELREKYDLHIKEKSMWWLYALLAAIFAALTSIFAKIGIEGVDSNLATAIRTVVVVGMAWLLVFMTNAHSSLGEISKRSWSFLILSGVVTGISWLCFYKALQLGEASKVVPIDKLSVVFTLIMAFVFLKEEFTVKSALGAILITAGTLVMVL